MKIRKAVNRIKKRYVLVKAESKDLVEKILKEYLGILGIAKARVYFVREDEKGIIISIDRGELDNIRAAFEVSNREVKVLRVSGTLKGIDRNL